MTKTAREMNRSPGEVVHVLPVPLVDARQMHYLRELAEVGHIGETPEEVAAFLILEGIDLRLRGKLLQPRSDWEGFKPMTSLLLCWYALGYVACGANFAVWPRHARAPFFICFVIPPFVLLAAFIWGIFEWTPKLDPAKQYLWRKP